MAFPSQLPPSTIRPRLSFAPTSMYRQPEREPRTITNADNQFRVTQNLRNGVPLSQGLPRQLSIDYMDPISPLATAMLTHQSMPPRQPQTMQGINWDLQLGPVPPIGPPSPTNMLAQQSMMQRQPTIGHANFLQKLQANRPNQLQPQRQQVTPPFNISK